MDRIDLQILREIQANGRISNLELAERVNLSPTPCQRRRRKLEDSGVVAHYTAVLDRRALGLEIYAVVFVTLTRNNRESGSLFEKTVKMIPEVVELCLVSGAYDYMLRIVCRSLEEYETLLKDRLASLDPVGSIETMVVINQLLSRTELPLSTVG